MTTPRLFEPLTLRQLTIRNRIWLSPMCQYAVTAFDGIPHEWHQVHLGARAVGGFGVVLTEATAISPEGRISRCDTGIWNDAQAEAWRPIVEFGQHQGAAMGIQLAHAGRKASVRRGFPGEASGVAPPSEGGWQPVGPSAEPFPGLGDPEPLTTAGIERLLEAWAAAARRADQAGFDLIEIHGAHGYLVHQFLSPLSNRRTDDYGGDFSGRTRLLLEVVDAVRSQWPADKPVVVRLSGTDWIDGGWTTEESRALAPLLAGRGVDLVDVSSGGNAPADIPVGPGYQVPLAASIRSGGIATGAVGLITEPAQAEQILAEGSADVVLLARAALREPAWPWRAAAELGLTVEESPYPAAYWRGVWPSQT